MSSNRAKLLLDEQAFQGLLAAAFTIQEHNDRKKNGGQDPGLAELFPSERQGQDGFGPEGESGIHEVQRYEARSDGVQSHYLLEETAESSVPPAAAKSASRVESAHDIPEFPPLEQAEQPDLRDTQSQGLETPDVEAGRICRRCGTPVPDDKAACSTCNAEPLRPGERLQRNWASMWLMSQKRGLWSLPQKNGDDGLPLSPADPGRIRQSFEESNGRVHGSQIHPGESLRILEVSDDRKRVEDVPSSNGSWAMKPRAVDLTEVSGNEPGSRNDFDGNDDSDLVTQAAVDLHFGVDTRGNTASHSLSGWRVKLRFRRADLYLGIAIVVAIIALLWPTATAQQPKLSAFERILIAVGIAEAPTPHAVHYHGDPNLRVWVDTHTALYYCPGDELYGKSPGGHYTTQHEAQSDQFEPAERSVCIE